MVVILASSLHGRQFRAWCSKNCKPTEVESKFRCCLITNRCKVAIILAFFSVRRPSCASEADQFLDSQVTLIDLVFVATSIVTRNREICSSHFVQRRQFYCSHLRICCAYAHRALLTRMKLWRCLLNFRSDWRLIIHRRTISL